MYEKFNAYWQEKKQLFERLGVSKDTAEMIFYDAVQIAEKENESDTTMLLNLHLNNKN